MRIANPKPNLKHQKDSHGQPVDIPIITEDQPGLPLPHERDESHSSQGSGPRRVIEQAKRDIDRGIVDTDRRSGYGMGEGKGLRKRSKK
jgi:hypothetical protein